MDDRALLNDYIERGSESAFKELVSRHLDFVFSAARRLAEDSQMAEEIAQTVFILLARKGAGLKKEVVLAGWLHRTTCFVAAHARRSEIRRRQREQEALHMQSTLSGPDENWMRLAPTLDEALERLGEADRDALLLRFFQRRSLAEVGSALGISEEAAKKRVSRGIEKLRVFFQKRGLAIGAGALAAALGSQGVQAAPAGLATTTVSTAADAGSVVGELASQAQAAWQWVRIKLALAWCVPAVAVLLIGGAVLPPISGGSTAKVAARLAAPAPVQNAPPAIAIAVTNTPEPSNAGPAFEFRVVDAQTGAGIPNAQVRALVWTAPPPKVETLTNLATDASGLCRIPLPTNAATFGRLDVGALRDGYVQRFYTWRTDKDSPLPAGRTLKLERAVKMSGVVRDADGNPIPGAELAIAFDGLSDYSDRETPAERLGFLEPFTVARTDAQGRWSCAIAPEGCNTFTIQITTKQVPGKEWSFRPAPSPYAAMNPFKLAELLDGSAVFTLDRGVALEGVVVDPQDAPVAGATVGVAMSDQKTRTDASGHFRLDYLTAGTVSLKVSAERFADCLMEANAGPDSEQLKIRLSPGRVLRIKVVNSEGKPVKETRIALSKINGARVMSHKDGTTDENGVWEWKEAPDGTLAFDVLAEGYAIVRDREVKVDGAEHVVKLAPVIKISGFVADAQTHLPIPAFKAIPGYGASERWKRGSTQKGVNGFYELTFSESENQNRVLIEADGYKPEVSPPLSAVNGTFDVDLVKAAPGDTIKGVVLGPDGRPAAGAQVGLCTPKSGLSLRAGQFDLSGIVAKCDQRGEFEFKNVESAHTIAAAHSSGYLRKAISTNGSPLTLQLQPWGRLEGTLGPNALALKPMCADVSSSTEPNYTGSVRFDQNAAYDASGHFTVECIPPGTFLVSLYMPGNGSPVIGLDWITVEPGQTVTKEFAANGAQVRGRFIAPEGVVIQWKTDSLGVCLSPLSDALASIPRPPPWRADDLEKMAYWQSPNAVAWTRATTSIGLFIFPDGSFVSYNAPAGNYTLQGTFTPGDSKPRRQTERLSIPVTVPEPDSAQPVVIDLGDIQVKMK